jgi:hypothetical protein
VIAKPHNSDASPPSEPIQAFGGETSSLGAGPFSHAVETSFVTTLHRYVIQVRLQLIRTLMLTAQDPLSQITLLFSFAG